MTIETVDGRITSLFDADTEERVIELAWRILVNETGTNCFVLFMGKRYLLNPDNEEWELVEAHRLPSSVLSARSKLRDIPERTAPKSGFGTTIRGAATMLGITTIASIVWALLTNKNGKSIDGH